MHDWLLVLIRQKYPYSSGLASKRRCKNVAMRSCINCSVFATLFACLTIETPIILFPEYANPFNGKQYEDDNEADSINIGSCSYKSTVFDCAGTEYSIQL